MAYLNYGYILFSILSLICLSSFILSYLLSFMFAMCFLLTRFLIITLISSICSCNEKVCSNVFYSVNWLYITFVINLFFIFLIFFLFLNDSWNICCTESLQSLVTQLFYLYCYFLKILLYLFPWKSCIREIYPNLLTLLRFMYFNNTIELIYFQYLFLTH